MLIYGALFIAIIFIIGLIIVKRREIVWWEIAIMLVIPLICVVTSKAIVEKVMTSDSEYWGGYVTAGRYEEHYNEYIEATCSYCCGHDSKGNCTSTCYYDCSYVSDHPPIWTVYNNLGESFSVSPQYWNFLVNKFGVNDWVAMHRKPHSHGFIDGNAYDTHWQGTFDSLEPTVSEHTYENRVIASTSIYTPKKVDPKTYGLFEYPEIKKPYSQQVIIGDVSDLGDLSLPERRLEALNGLLGKEKQIKLFIVVFNNKPIQAALEQRDYWQGINKNEFVIMIGRSGSDIQWVYPVSWQDNKQLDVDTRNYLLEQKTLDVNVLYNLVDWIQPQIRENWHRKHFREFNYLSVEPPLWALITSYLVTLLLTGGFAVWSVMNGIDNESVEDIRFGDDYEIAKSWSGNQLIKLRILLTNTARRCYSVIRK